MHKNKNLLTELWGFMRLRKKWWLLPSLIILLLVGLLMIVGQLVAVSPFIYVLF